jgi:hypothetical protein
MKRKRYCLVCHVFKPDRTHHCSVCNRCVLNMDHHCPWIHNCIGFYNRKVFILILVYACGSLYEMIGVMIPVAYKELNHLLEYPSSANMKIYIQLGVTCFVLLLSIAITKFTTFHMKLVLENSTTIEQQSDLYDLGYISNIEKVFGKCKSLWLIPYYGTKGLPYGNGVVWEMPSPASFATPIKESENSKETPKQIIPIAIEPPRSYLPNADSETDSSVFIHQTIESTV